MLALAMDSAKFRHLSALLMALAADSAELVRLLRADVRIDRSFFDGLPSAGHCSFADYLGKVVERLHSFGLVDGVLLQAFAVERPHQRGRLARAALQLGLLARHGRATVYLLHAGEIARADTWEPRLRSQLETLADIVCVPVVGTSVLWTAELVRGSYLIVDPSARPILKDMRGRQPEFDTQELVVLAANDPDALIDMVAADAWEVPRMRHMGPSVSPLSSASRREIRRVACHCLDRTALSGFLWDANLAEGSLSGDSLHAQVLALLHLVDRDALISQFLDYLWEERGRCVEHALRTLRSEGA